MILDEIAEKTRERIAEQKRQIDGTRQKAMAIERQEKEAAEGNVSFPFAGALRAPDMTFICEVKKASPSKGVIAKEFPYTEIAADYEKAGAGAISVLTEPFYFQGSNSYLKEIRKEVSLPILRKDFVVDEYMIYEAKNLGADAILLICSILSQNQLEEYYGIAASLGLDVLTEAHDAKEIEMAERAGVNIIGVNNRNLRDFTVDFTNSLRLRPLVPKDCLFVSESGICGPKDIKSLKQAGVDAVLVGELMMREADKKRALAWLKGAAEHEEG